MWEENKYKYVNLSQYQPDPNLPVSIKYMKIVTFNRLLSTSRRLTSQYSHNRLLKMAQPNQQNRHFPSHSIHHPSYSLTSYRSSQPQTNGNSPQRNATVPLTSQTQSQIPTGPSNTTTYLSSSDTAEQLAMGQSTERNAERTARELAEWEAYWRGVGGQ